MAGNNYIPEYVLSNLKWYERDGLLTYIDQLKCNRFLADPDKHFQEIKVIKFDIIYKTIRGEKIPEKTLKDYQTVKAESTKAYPKKDQDKFLSSVFGIDRKDIYFEKKKVID